MKKMKIGVVGMGPVGQILAVHLKEAGCDIAICDIDKEKMNLIRKHGVTLEGKIKKQSYFNNVFTSMHELSEFNSDLLIFSVKAHHMDSILADFPEDKIDKNLCVMSAQNGIDIEKKLSKVFGDSQTLRMVVNFAGNLHAPNVSNVTFFNPPNYIASIDDTKHELANLLSELLNSVHLTTHSLDSFKIVDKIWEKTILNSSLSALCGITKLTRHEAMAFQDMVDIVEQVILEAIEVAKAEEIKFPENFVKLCMRYLKKAGNHFPSLAVDLLNGRETEIDYLNGKIVEYGKKHYIRTPLNLTFTSLVRAATYKNNLSRTQQKSFAETVVDM